MYLAASGADEMCIRDRPRYAHVRGTADPFRQDITGSDKSYPFRYEGNGNQLFVFEAPIDLLSFICLYPDVYKRQHLYDLITLTVMQLFLFYLYLVIADVYKRQTSWLEMELLSPCSSSSWDSLG